MEDITIQDLYNWAKDHSYLDYKIRIKYRDEGGVFDRITGEGLDVIGEDGIKKYATKSEVEYILSTVEALSNATHIKKEDCNFQELTQETADRLLNSLQKIAKYNKLWTDKNHKEKKSKNGCY